MKINIYLNDTNYNYQVFQLFNVYFPMTEIKFTSYDESSYRLIIDGNNITFNSMKLNKKSELDAYDVKDSIRRFLFRCLKEITGDEHPWGILIGIRPSKIALNYLKEEKSEEEIIDIFKNKYLASKEKAELCIKVAKNEEKFVNRDQNTVSVYIGMPFCPTRCLYCSFVSNSLKTNGKMVVPYLEALRKEIRALGSYIKEKNLKIECVYFGGGTPTAVSDGEFMMVMDEIYNAFIKDSNETEFTVECGRPDTITENKLKTMKECMVKRISINPQTMNDKTLHLIGRTHSKSDIIEKFNLARKLGFDDINMDIIIGLPNETQSEMTVTKNELLKLKPDSITVHGLSLKRGSRMHEEFVLNKGIKMTEHKEILKMYQISRNLVSELKLSPYYMYRQKNMVGNLENVGYCKDGKECHYNIQMIEERETTIALGAGAVSKIVNFSGNKIDRYPNLKNVTEYVNRVDSLIDGKISLLDTIYK
ncbi:coproporphyrinogen III oxidase [Clostridium sp. BJN0001]|uniref:coproporphyrinogen III oxidase n=1 Tax=Clostridium sp. BJN0001 TaxID=2930219 RepID=UPI001FD2E346|nr:coproporphyrinogen III oxidase [Clostridium sp. BJN0001]